MERRLVLISLFAALIAALGLLPKFTLASGVPITAQGLGVMLAGTVLGSRNGFLAVALFVGLTLMGLPLLAGGRGGLGLLQTPSVGFILGFPIAAYVTGRIVELSGPANLLVWSMIGAVVGCMVVLYTLGTIGMAVTLDKSLMQAALLNLPFVIGDAIKVVIAGILTQTLGNIRPEIVLSRSK